MSLTDEVSQLFDTELTLYKVIENLQRDAWMGKIGSMNLRALVWRLLLGIIPSSLPLENWSSLILSKVKEYNTLKDREYPKIDRVSVDPLTSMSNESDEWKKYYKDVELCNFIMVDLDRLYMNGFDDEYFQTKERRDILVSVLFLWAARHPVISYRQGMHEIAGPILFCVESELEAFVNSQSIASSHPTIACCFNQRDFVEAHTFWLFERIMDELELLYDPNPPSSSSASGRDVALPAIVTFCAKVQEHFLRDLDPDLCTHLEDCFIQSQLYGLRWCRLLFGREISVTKDHGLRVWDYIFACCTQGPNNFYTYPLHVKHAVGRTLPLAPVVTETNVNSECVSPVSPLHPSTVSTVAANRMDPQLLAMIGKKAGYSPMIAAVADIMLAMLLLIRADLVDGDSNTVMMLLMRYPEVQDVSFLLNYADMIRRGVMRSGVHLGKDLSVYGELEQQAASAMLYSSSSSSPRKTPNWLARGSETVKKVLTFNKGAVSSSNNSSNYPSTPTTQQQTHPSEMQRSNGSGFIDDPFATLGTMAVDATSSMSSMMSMAFGGGGGGGSGRPTMQPPAQMGPKTPQGAIGGSSRVEEYWSGGVSLGASNINEQSFGLGGNGESGIVAMYENLRQSCSMVSSRLTKLAQNLLEKELDPKMEQNVQTAADSEPASGNSGVDFDIGGALRSLASVLDGTSSLEDFDSKFPLQLDSDVDDDNSKCNSGDEPSLASQGLGDNYDSRQQQSHSASVAQALLAETENAAAAAADQQRQRQYAPNITPEPHSVSFPVPSVPNVHVSPVSPVTPATPASTFASSITSPSGESTSNNTTTNSNQTRSQPSHIDEHITTTINTVQGFVSDKPAVSNLSLLDSLIGSPSSGGASQRSTLSLTTFGEENQKKKSVDSIFL